MIIHSVLRFFISRYLALKQALGRRYAGESRILGILEQFLVHTNAEDLTQETFSEWCKTQKVTSTVLRRRMSIVRNLCLYRKRTEPDCFVPDAKLFPLARPPAPPYIFTETEIAKLIQAGSALKPVPRSPLRPQVSRLAIVLLYTTGLRRGELLKLTIGDYDSQSRTLLVRESKFHKSRYLALSSDAVCEVETYLRARCKQRLSLASETPLVWNGYGSARPYTGTGLSEGIHVLLRCCKVHTPEGRLPRIHDFRHTFAVHALLRWYRTGSDLQAKLPMLATYMGHVSVVSTQYYLPFVEGLALAASERFQTYCGPLVTTTPKSNGDK